jgi:hypothetical protein
MPICRASYTTAVSGISLESGVHFKAVGDLLGQQLRHGASGGGWSGVLGLVNGL